MPPPPGSLRVPAPPPPGYGVPPPPELRTLAMAMHSPRMRSPPPLNRPPPSSAVPPPHQGSNGSRGGEVRWIPTKNSTGSCVSPTQYSGPSYSHATDNPSLRAYHSTGRPSSRTGASRPRLSSAHRLPVGKTKTSPRRVSLFLSTTTSFRRWVQPFSIK